MRALMLVAVLAAGTAWAQDQTSDDSGNPVVLKDFIPDSHAGRVPPTVAESQITSAGAAASTLPPINLDKQPEAETAKGAKPVSAAPKKETTEAKQKKATEPNVYAPEAPVVSANPEKTQAATAKKVSSSAKAKSEASAVVITDSKEPKAAKSSDKVNIAKNDIPAGALKRPDSRDETGDRMTVHGRIVAIMPRADSSLRMSIDTGEELVQADARPIVGMRVPRIGTDVRVSGHKIGSSSRGPVIEAEQIEREGGDQPVVPPAMPAGYAGPMLPPPAPIFFPVPRPFRR